jgi:excinuclease ABC subunit C
MKAGNTVVKDVLLRVPELPGIYQMFDVNGDILYIGKAKNLKNRLKTYISSMLSTRIINLVEAIASIEYIVTSNEAEALLLEARLIKSHQPKYNILLKDDKSFPYIMVRSDHNIPQILKYRGKLSADNLFFGPFASIGDVNNALKFLHKTFKLRNCTDAYFNQRKRPCLQYEIGMCSAPCVGKISDKEYHQSFSEAIEFLSGNSTKLQASLAVQMNEYSENMNYERAAVIRDKIKNLSYIQMESSNYLSNLNNIDVIVAVANTDSICIAISFYRFGHYYGHKIIFPEKSMTSVDSIEELLSSFVSVFYQNKLPPDEVILSHKIYDMDILEDALSQIHGTKVKISVPIKSVKKTLIDKAIAIATEGLNNKIKHFGINRSILERMAQLFHLTEAPLRIEIYDNSHIMGSFAVGAFVVSTPSGFDKKEYRYYNVENKIGDDYAMLREVITRRCSKLLKDNTKTPDLMLIDGGKGQLSVVTKVMQGLSLDIPVVAIAKGPDRNSGREFFYLTSGEEMTLDRNDPLMKYLQILRDEAHRFAITTHRNKRTRAIMVSSLDHIKGVGKTRKRALLHHFGSVEAIRSATVEDICKVYGVSRELAKEILEHL